MISNLLIPDLNFPEVPLNETEKPWDLLMFLYKGASAARKDAVRSAIDAGTFGHPIVERLSLTLALHGEVGRIIARGNSKKTLENVLTALRAYFRFVDQAAVSEPSIASAAHLFVEWMEFYALRVSSHKMQESSRYRYGVTAGAPLARAIGRSESSLLRAAKLERKGRKSPVFKRQDKQNLEHTFAMGHALLDICDSLTEEAIRGKLPVVVTFRNGQVFEDWCGRRRASADDLLKMRASGSRVSDRQVEQRRQLESDNSNRQRSGAVNTRLDAELLIFIAQTGMNLTQAWKAQVGDFRYESISDGYGVRRYKGRRLGEIEFHIFSEYRAHFDKFLRWRAEIFSEDPSELLFPFLNRKGEPASHSKRTFREIEERLRAARVKLVRPQALRQTRINWMLRRTGDPGLTAEMHGHSVEVLHDEYERPHHQRAVAEVTRFWRESDPSIASPGPGACVVVQPVELPNIPVEAPKPDCQAPDGCLFCANQRDLDTLDHVWSLASLRYLKTQELARDVLWMQEPHKHPAHRVIERITQKLDFFAHSNKERAIWVEEAAMRLSEGRYHKRWSGWIALAELSI